MALTFEELEQEALALPDKERAELATQLWATLEPAVDSQLDEAWGALAVDRLAEMRSGKVIGVSADEAFATVRQQLRA